jgi:spore coat polysaccharide biosynthesis protein SpsF
MTSTRLPGKVLRPIAGRPMLAYQLERLQRVRRADRLVVATTKNSADDPIVSLARALDVPHVRGPEHDVLARFVQAAREFGASCVVRATADCPLIDPALVDESIEMFAAPPGRYDFVSNMLEPSYPYGMAVEVFSARALEAAHGEARDESEREHVTPFFYWRPERFQLGSMKMQPDLSSHRWTVDTREDFDLVARILAELYPRNPHFCMADVLALLEEHPEWEAINRGVHQTTVIRPPSGDAHGA